MIVVHACMWVGGFMCECRQYQFALRGVVYLVYIIIMWWCVHVHMYIPIGGNGCGGSTCVCIYVCVHGARKQLQKQEAKKEKEKKNELCPLKDFNSQPHACEATVLSPVLLLMTYWCYYVGGNRVTPSDFLSYFCYSALLIDMGAVIRSVGRLSSYHRSFISVL